MFQDVDLIEEIDSLSLWFEEVQAYQSKRKARELNFSARLDVHRWSDHPEVKGFVQTIYESVDFKNSKVRRRHLKVVLLDLYVKWCQSADLKTAVSRNRNDYRAGSIYNELRISFTTVAVLDALLNFGFIHEERGFLDRTSGIGRVSRIWPTEKLIALFEDARFGTQDIGYHPDRVSVVLRDKDEDGKEFDVEYEPSEATDRMSTMLQAYNLLLARAHIELPSTDNRLVNDDDVGQRCSIKISQSPSEKFVTRVFNRGSFECGGRFFGGWWQNCRKELRNEITIDGHPTSELDYSGLHIVMLYAEEGISYWDEVGTDPYQIDVPDFLEDAAQTRSVCKSLMLTMLNAKSDLKAFAAFRSDALAGSMEKKLTNEQLAIIQKALKERHKPIAKHFCNDAGIRLMNKDSMIAEHVLQRFTNLGVPALTLHDSFIVPLGYEDLLMATMRKAFSSVMEVSLGPVDSGSIKKY